MEGKDRQDNVGLWTSRPQARNRYTLDALSHFAVFQALSPSQLCSQVRANFSGLHQQKQLCIIDTYLAVLAAIPYTYASRASTQLCLGEHLAWTLQHHLPQSEVYNSKQLAMHKCSIACLRLCNPSLCVHDYTQCSRWSCYAHIHRMAYILCK